MPYFTMGVIVPATETDIQTFVDRQVDRYDTGFPISNCDGSRLINRSDHWVTGTGNWVSGVRNTGSGEVDSYSRDPKVIDHAFPTTDHALVNGIIPHAIITPSGRWHNHYNIWGPGDYHEDLPRWNKKARRLLRRYRGHRMMILVTTN